MAIICHCAAVRDRTVIEAVHAGAHDLEAVRTVCGAAADCGGCADAVAKLVARVADTVTGTPAGLPRLLVHAG